MSKWINRAFVFANAALMVVALFYICTRGLAPAVGGFEYKDLVVILLAAITVILAAVTLFVALIAIWGYNAIREAAEVAARIVAKDTAEIVAARVAQTTVDLSGGSSPTPDIKTADELTAALQARDSENGGEDEK